MRKSRWLLGLALLGLLYLVLRPDREPKPAPEPKRARPVAEAPAATPPPPEPPPTPTPPAETPPSPTPTAPSPPAPAPAKTRFKPEDHRKVDLPLPKSPKEVIENRTAFQPPLLPARPNARPSLPDRGLPGYYAGYAYLADGSTRKIRIQYAWGDLKFAIEDHPGDIRQWSRREQTLRVDNFKNDAYSLVLETADGRIMYLKFNNEARVPGYKDPLAAWHGWLLSDASDAPSVARVALLDVHEHNRMFPPGTKDAEEWPKRGALQSLTSEFTGEAKESPNGARPDPAE